MYQTSLGNTDTSQESASCPSTSRVLKIITYKPTRQQVLILLDFPTTRIIMANAALAVESCTKGLVEAYSKLRVKSIQDGMFMSTNSIALVVELEVIKQWLKKTASLSENTEVEPCLPQSKSFLRVLGVFYWDSNTFLFITPTQVVAALSSSPLFEGVILAFLSYIIKVL